LKNKGGVMTTIEFKKKLIKQINNIEDELLLQEMSRLADIGDKESDIYYFTKEERDAVEEARKQYARGEYLSNEEANKEIDEWLGE
jgi:DICT domain-containing protein